MSTYCMECSVCKGEFTTRHAWLSHLLQPDHQSLAQGEVINWNEEMKECAIVAFATFPVSSLHLLQHFSRGYNIVTDFVGIPDKPEVGILQFESKRNLKGVLKKMGGRQTLVDNRLVQLRKADDYLDLEWNQLLRELMKKVTLNETATVVKELTTVNIGASLRVEGSQLLTPPPDKNGSPSSSASGDRDITSNSNKNSNRNSRPISVPCVNPGVTADFKDLLSIIYKQQEIPEQDFCSAVMIMAQLNTILIKDFPYGKFYLFRYWYNRLKTNGVNELLIYFDCKGELTGNLVEREGQGHINFDDLERYLMNPKVQKILPAWSRPHPKGLDPDGELEYRGIRMQHQFSGLFFTLVTHPNVIREVQTCRLHSFLCSLDPRAMPLLTIVHYWASVNNIVLGKSTKNPDSIPGPAGLEWLVILFLCKVGVLPSPRQVLNKCELENQVIEVGVPIGFTTKFLWKPTSAPPLENTGWFTLHILKLARDFFRTFSDLNDGRWILNTRDGEIIQRTALFERTSRFSKISLTRQEIDLLRTKLSSQGSSPGNISLDKVVLLHPLHFDDKFSFCSTTFVSSICDMMSKTENKLAKFLEKYKKNQVAPIAEFEAVFLID